MKQAPTPEELEAKRRRVTEDPNTARIAKNVGMTLEAYVEIVMKYVANPNLKPTVTVVSDEKLRAAGFTPVDRKKATDYIRDIVSARNITTKSKFADPNSQREKVDGKIPVPPPATAAPREVRQDLKDELERERSSGKFKKF